MLGKEDLKMGEFAVSVAGRLGELLVQEGKFLHKVSGQIEFIQFELDLMQMYLEDADKWQIQDKRVQTWISKIRQTAYDVEDILETFLIKIASRRRGGIKNAFKRYACIINEAAELHKVGSKIENIKTRITNLTRCLETYGIKHTREYEEGHSSVIERIGQWRPSYSHDVVEEDTVGLDGYIKILVEELLNEEQCRAVSICGMGGLGKTTLAKKVYQHQAIKSHFNGLAWVFISHQQFQPRNIWEGILFELISPTTGKQIEEILKSNDAEVANKLCQVQRRKKCLVILDDIRTKEAWDSLRCAFPLGNSGSKILLTTRDKEVDPSGFCLEPQPLTEEDGWSFLKKKAFPEGSAVHVDSRSHLHNPQCLTEEEGRSLSQNKAFSSPYECSKLFWERFPFNVRQYIERLVLTVSRRINPGQSELTKKEKAFLEGTDGKIDEDMVMLGREMVKRCGGLPLAIAVLGEILVSKSTYEWKMVNDNIDSYLRCGKDHEQQQFGVNEFLALNYYNLPNQLKPCFLYLGHFPKGTDIPTKKLVRMWVAEGLVSSMQYEVEEAETMEEVAERYLKELLKRNMVQEGKKGSTGRVKTCCLHNHMRAVCFSKATEENFLELVYDHDGNELMSGSFSSMVTNAKLSHRIHRIVIEDKAKKFSLKRERAPYLRSLVVRGAGAFYNELCNFKLLRVLDLEAHESGMLPRAIGDLIHLRYFNLKFDEAQEVIIIPSSIGNLRFLQTLIINIVKIVGSSFRFEVPNVIWKMEQLRHLCLPHCKEKNNVKLQLGNLRELQTLKIFDARNFDVKELTKLSNLRELKIVSLRSLKELEGARSIFIGLRNLFLEGKIVKLPECFNLCPRLTKLTLQRSELEEDPMATLVKLHNLTLLRLQHNAFKGIQMTCPANGFPRLKSLQLAHLYHLEEWLVENEAMRSLCKLEIRNCSKLNRVPVGLRFITTLQELDIFDMPEEFENSVKEEGEDPHRLRHVHITFKHFC